MADVSNAQAKLDYIAGTKTTIKNAIDNNVWSPTDYPEGWLKI